MAVAGAPRIVTQTATNLRVSNETETGFVQQASTGLTNTIFDGEEIHVLADRIIVRRIEANGINALNLYDFDLNLLNSAVVANSGEWTFSFNEMDSLFVAYGKTVAISTANQAVSLNADRTALTIGPPPTGLGQGTGGNGVVRAATSPDGTSIVQLSQTGQRRFYNRIAAYQYGQVAPTGSPPGGTGSIIEWTGDSRFILISSNDKIVVYAKDGAAYDYRSAIDVASVGQTIHQVAVSPDNVFLAVSTVEDDGGLTVYATRMYKRGGEEFMPISTIADFGSSLAWNAQGDQLYDAGNRRAFKRTPNSNSFVELAGFMTNIPAGVLQSETSPHIEFPVGAATFFDGALFGVINGDQVMTGWAIALLDDAYVFESAAPDASTILSTHEVFGGHWPEGGKEVTNVQFKAYGSRGAFLDADDVTQTIYEGSITSRYALVYDTATNRPLVFIDFQKSIIAEQNSKMTLKMGDFGFILISP